MTVAVTLLVGAAVVALAAPWLLGAAADRAVDPGAVIAGWVLAVTGVLATTAAGLLLVAAPGYAAGSPPARLVHRPWWSAVSDAEQLLAYRVAGWVAPVLLALLGLRVAAVARRRYRDGRRAGASLDRLRMVAETDRCPAGGPPTLWLRADRPAAFSVGGRGRAVVLTDGLRARLSEPAVQAVLAHERAHLRGRHHAVVAVAELLATALPAVRLFAAAPAALREQAELAADRAAVRRCGPAAVGDALVALAGAASPVPAAAAGSAGSAGNRPVRRPAPTAAPSPAAARLARCATVGVLAAAGPLLVACVLLLGLSLLAVVATALA